MKSIITFSLFIFVWASADAQIYVKQDASGANDGTSWENAFTNLQSALDEVVEDSEIWIAAGNYIPEGANPQESHFWLLKPAKLYGGFAGNETTLSERNWELNPTILNGDKNGDDVENNFSTKRQDNAHHILILNAGDGESIIDGLIFQGGTTRVDTYVPIDIDTIINRWFGGALYIYKSPVTVRNSKFYQNNGFRGGGIFILGNPPEVIHTLIENSLFENNNAAGIGNGRGGGIYIVDAQESLIKNCKFIANQTTEGGGGLAVGNSNADVTGCEFRKNIGKLGGGLIFFHNTSSKIDYTSHNLLNSTFLENTAFDLGGGLSLFNLTGGFSLDINSCLFEKNKCTNIYGDGGAISVEDHADLFSVEPRNEFFLSNSIIKDGQAGFSGGIAIGAYDDSLIVKMDQIQILNNKGLRTGGGLYMALSNLAHLDIEIKNSVFDNNSTDIWTGAGIQFDAYENIYIPSLLFDSCIFSNNVALGAGGAFNIYLYDGQGPNSVIRNSFFSNNSSVGQGGAFNLTGGEYLIENTTLSDNNVYNSDNSDQNGGGAISMSNTNLTMRNSIIEKNTSEDDGAAIYAAGGSKADMENVLFLDNHAKNTIYSRDSFSLRNVTMLGNNVALGLDTNSHTIIQNSIFSSEANNLEVLGPYEILSKGGNISTDNSMSEDLNGYGQYDDMHTTNPMLNFDLVPENGSPALDAGNPEGVTSLMDLAGNPRIQGSAIDIGSFESFLTSIKNVIWNNGVISVYPNPVNEILNLKFESPWLGETNISIYNQLGQKVYSAEKNKVDITEVFQENVLSLINGHYIVLVKAGQQTYASTILIQR